ncbi:MAG: PHP domain-containing protein, partial [Saprospiraceae bacterium]|nr:PHP domain-containing protein [Saprospiraceae bacterium]
QWQEIDLLNKQYGESFRIFKSIESDILSDGSLDYRDEILSQFDLVIASVHSVLNMDEDRATSRLIKAIEHPCTRILGHPTGRLLLARPGYPLNFEKIIDACAANNVVIELNANPQRLDIDWKWIPYCMSKGVLIAINPDAHSKESIHYIRYGTTVARKGGLTAEMCLNTKSLSEFITWLAV